MARRPSSSSWPVRASSSASALARAMIGGVCGLLGRRQQAEAAQPDADPQLAARPGERDRQDQAGDRRRHPDDERGRNQAGGEQSDEPERGVRAMAAHDAGEGDRAVVAALRVPAGVAPGKNLQHRARLDHHHDRRQRGGNDDLDQRRQDEADRPAAAASGRRVDQGGDQAEKSWARAAPRSSIRTGATRARSRNAARPGKARNRR